MKNQPKLKAPWIILVVFERKKPFLETLIYIKRKGKTWSHKVIQNKCMVTDA